jgi:hypothetical protein
VTASPYRPRPGRSPAPASSGGTATAAAFAVSCASLAASSVMVAPTARRLLTANGRQHLLRDAPADTTILLVLQGGLLVASAAATVVLGAVVLSDVVTRRPQGRAARWAPAPVRRAATAVARLGLATGAVVPALLSPARHAAFTPAASASPSDPARPAGSDDSPTARPEPSEARTPGIAVMTELGPGASTPSPHAAVVWLDEAPAPPLTPTANRTPADPRPEADAEAEPDPDQTWVVAAGDSFWSIAEEVLAEAGDRDPAEDDVADYWARLISANRGRLLVAANADILQVGQALILPPVP